MQSYIFLHLGHFVVVFCFHLLLLVFVCLCLLLLTIDHGRQRLLKIDWLHLVLIWLQFLFGTGGSALLMHVWCTWCGTIKTSASEKRKL